MNKLTIIGNVTRDPELRTTQTGKEVCSFTVAVNWRGKDKDPDYFNVNAWDKLAGICKEYLSNGKKVCVVGAVSARTYQDRNGETRVSLDVRADEVEFLSPKDGGYTQVNDKDDPFRE